MDDLRWVLLLVGVVVVVVIYFSSRFEREDWTRERENFRGTKKKLNVKPRRSTAPMGSTRPAAPVAPKIKKEPRMESITELVAGSTSAQVSETSLKSEPVLAFDDPGPSTTNPPISTSVEDNTVKPTVIPTTAALHDIEKDLAEPTVGDMSAAASDTARGNQAPAVSKRSDENEDETSDEEQAVVEKTVTEDASETGIVEQEARAPTKAVQETAQEIEQETEQDTGQEDITIEDGIEDQITDVEIPVDLAVAEAQIQAEQVVDKSAAEEPKQVELPLGIEPLVLAVSVMAEEGERFTGTDLREALEAEGLSYGAMQIFHYFDAGADASESDEAVFSVANVTEPGFFDLDALEEVRTPGVMLFCQLPGPLAGEAALELMLDKGRGLAVRLEGQMCDDRRNRFTAQAKTLYKDRIAAFNRELVLARKKNAR